MKLRDSHINDRSRVSEGIAGLFYIALILIVMNGCASRKQESDARLISANLSISSYAKARQQATATTASSFDFPVLEIYNDSGILVYSGHESSRNAQTLREFPVSVRNLPPARA